MDREIGDNGRLTDLPWASVFDPTANARAFTAIQAEGFRAASQLVDRFVQVATSGATAGSTEPSAASGNGSAAGEADATDLGRLVRSWWSLTGEFLRESARVANPASVDRATLDLANQDATGALAVVAAPSGSVTAEVWLHNRSAKDLGDVRLRCSDLLAHDGGLIGSTEVTFDPVVVPMPARCSRGVAMRIDVASGVTPGRYRGSVLAEGHPDLWLPVDLTVRSPAT